jgi:cyclic nucleotide-binding protein
METLASVDLVRSVAIFAGLTERQLESVVRAGRLAPMRAGVRLLKAGNVPGEVSIVVSGHVRVVDERGEIATPFDILGPGAHFGETLLDATPAPFSIYAQSDGELLAIGRRELDRLAVDWPDVEPALLEHVMHRRRTGVDEHHVPHPVNESIQAADSLDRDVADGEPASAEAEGARFDGDGRIVWRRREFVRSGPDRCGRATPVLRAWRRFAASTDIV